MRTARQGTLDGHCGLYAVVNALELVGIDPPRGSRLHWDLFHQLSHGLGAVTLLASMQDGLEAHDLVAAATLAFRWLHAVHGFELAIIQPLRDRRLRSPRSFLAALRGFVDQPETAVIISYERGWYAHWTVVRALTSTKIELRDSGGVGALQLADFRKADSVCRFRTADTLLIKRVG